MRFCHKPTNLGGKRGSAGTAGLRHDFRAGDQFVQPRPGFGSISLLRPVRARGDDQHAVLRGATAGECEEALPHVGWERWRLADIEAQLDGSGNLVHVLPARAGTANKGHGEFGIWNEYRQMLFPE